MKLKTTIWGRAKDRVRLFEALRRVFPDRKLPYSYKEMLEIGRCVGVQDLFGLWSLRMDLREHACDTLKNLDNEGDISKSKRRNAINKGIIKPIDKLFKSTKYLSKIGAEEAFSLAHDDGYGVNIETLLSDLEKLKSWAEAAQEKVMDGSVPKGRTVVKQGFVDRLYAIYHAVSGKTPVRNVGRDGDAHYEGGDFTTFVNLCSKPIFVIIENFSRQIRNAINEEKGRIEDIQKKEAGQKQRKKNEDFIQSIESKIKPS